MCLFCHTGGGFGVTTVGAAAFAAFFAALRTASCASRLVAGKLAEVPIFDHDTVNHSAGEFVRDGVTTNGIESVFAVLKRGLIGVYHHTSNIKKHLGRYVDEFAFRLNEGNVKHHTLTRLDSFIDGVVGKRLTYKGLIQ